MAVNSRLQKDTHLDLARLSYVARGCSDAGEHGSEATQENLKKTGFLEPCYSKCGPRTSHTGIPGGRSVSVDLQGLPGPADAKGPRDFPSTLKIVKSCSKSFTKQNSMQGPSTFHAHSGELSY